MEEKNRNNSHKINKKLFIDEFSNDNTFLDSKPCGMVVLLTTRCNISCIMCGWWKENPYTELPYEAIEKIFSILPTLEMVNWQGGEPFVVPYFKDLYKKVAEEHPHIQQSISTNGLLIDGEWAKILANSFLEITFSIDGIDKKTYEYIRRGAKYEDLIKAIKRLNREIKNTEYVRVVKTLFVVIMKCNYKDIVRFIEFAKKYEFEKVQFAQKFGDPPEEEICDPPDEKAIAYIKGIIPQTEILAKEYNLEFTHPFGYLYTKKEIARSYPGKKANKTKKCNLPWYKLTLLPNGDVKPDCVCEVIAGNILKQDILEVWNGPVMRKYRENIISGKTKDFCADICNKGGYLGILLNKID